MIKHSDISKQELWKAIHSGAIVLGGNASARIYGTLSCKSGKRLYRDNRVFFASEAEAIALGYRPCGHCMRDEYKKWKDGLV